MLGYTRIRNGLCAICRWSKKVRKRGGFCSEKFAPQGRCRRGECEGDADCHGYLKTNHAMTSFLRGVRPDGTAGTGQSKPPAKPEV